MTARLLARRIAMTARRIAMTARLLALAALVIVAGCGDNVGPCTGRGAPVTPVPCPSGACTDVHVVAHPDDDLLFMNPDIAGELAGGHKVVVVYVTAAELTDATRESYWRDRERGVLAAYGFLLHGGPLANRDGIDAMWSGAVEQLGGLTFQTYRSGAVTLVFLRLGDMQTQCLWEDANGCSTLDTHPVAPPYLAMTKGCADCTAPIAAQQVSRGELIDVLAQLMTREAATSVATLDSTSLYFDALGPASDGYHEYWDHYFTGLFATAAAARARLTLPGLALRSYRGYTVAHAPANLDQDAACTKLDAFAHYAMYDTGVVKAARRSRFVQCPSCFFNDAYGVISADSWERRQVVTASREPATFVVRHGDTCITHAMTLGDCADAAVFARTPDGQLASGGQCLAVATAGGHVDVPAPGCSAGPCTAAPPIYPPEPVTLGACTAPAEGSSLFAFDNGQLRTANARCLTAAGTTAGAAITSDDCRAATAHGHVADAPDPAQAWTLEAR